MGFKFCQLHPYLISSDEPFFADRDFIMATLLSPLISRMKGLLSKETPRKERRRSTGKESIPSWSGDPYPFEEK